MAGVVTDRKNRCPAKSWTDLQSLEIDINLNGAFESASRTQIAVNCLPFNQIIGRLKPTRKELPVGIEPVSEIVTELDEVSPVIEDTIRNYEFEYEDLLRLLRTKDGLKGEAYVLTKDVRQLENTYRKLYAPVQEMSELYTACKNEVVFFRYKSLKEMIKTCINTYEQLKKDEKVKSEKGENNLKGAGAFLDVATETKEIMAEVEPLRKAELLQHIEDKKIKRERLKGKMQLLDNCIQSLQTEYTTSKQEHTAARYKLLKNMVKMLIRAENLRP